MKQFYYLLDLIGFAFSHIIKNNSLYDSNLWFNGESGILNDPSIKKVIKRILDLDYTIYNIRTEQW